MAESDCLACGDTHGQPMMYCGAFLNPMDCAYEDCSAETESMSEESFDPPPPTLPLVESPEMYDIEPRLTVREQEIRFIEEHGLVAFCHRAIITAVIQDADYLRAQLDAFCHRDIITAIIQDEDYLRAQLVYLGKR